LNEVHQAEVTGSDVTRLGSDLVASHAEAHQFVGSLASGRVKSGPTVHPASNMTAATI
jgi:hypothetical protein